VSCGACRLNTVLYYRNGRLQIGAMTAPDGAQNFGQPSFFGLANFLTAEFAFAGPLAFEFLSSATFAVAVFYLILAITSGSVMLTRGSWFVVAAAET